MPLGNATVGEPYVTLATIAGVVPKPTSGTWSFVLSLPPYIYGTDENRAAGKFRFAVAARWTRMSMGRPLRERSQVMEGGDLVPLAGHFLNGSTEGEPSRPTAADKARPAYLDLVLPVSPGTAIAMDRPSALSASTVLPGDVVCPIVAERFSAEKYMVKSMVSHRHSL